MERLKIGVVGTGKMGKNHCASVAKLRDVKLAGVYDVQQEVSALVAKTFHTVSYPSYESMLKSVDAVILAIPPSLHCEYLGQAIAAGRDVFVEKPCVTTLEEVQQVQTWLRNTDVIVQVGYIERFNPAIIMLHQLVNREELVAIEAHRSGLSDRSLDVDVVLDLMTHDLDIILSFISEPIAQIAATAIVSAHRGMADLATAAITFQSGIVANLVASRISHRAVRVISITEQARTVVADSAHKDVFVYRSPEAGIREKDKKLIYITQDVIAVPHGDALYDELVHFVDCVRTRKQPLVDGWSGLRSVEVAAEIRRQIYGS